MLVPGLGKRKNVMKTIAITIKAVVNSENPDVAAARDEVESKVNAVAGIARSAVASIAGIGPASGTLIADPRSGSHEATIVVDLAPVTVPA